MPDILMDAAKEKGGGLKTPSQTDTIRGPGKNTSNRYAGKKQSKKG